ncbi:MAG TPA: right-handed parallel beta-helix repeat-containing protein [Chloroflexota bacterium]|nr:right-handed parallel beta-helix repeat-containing protein [Chloroflexota bacterium]
MRALRELVPLVLAVALLFTMRAAPAYAATFEVTTTEDGHDANPGDGICSINPPGQPPLCSLRAAIEEVNALGIGQQTIYLPANTYTLPLGSLFLSAPEVSIFGDGEATTIVDGTNMPGVRPTILGVCSSGCMLSLQGLTLQHASGCALLGGTSGGGTSTIFLTNVTLRDNSRTAICNYLTLILNTVTVRDNGATDLDAPGGILNSGGSAQLTASNLTVTGNRSGSSTGGVLTESPGSPWGGLLVISGGTISGNSSQGGPAGGISGGTGSNGSVSLTNTTVSNNTNVAGGATSSGIAGGINAVGSWTFDNVTISGNQIAGTPGVGVAAGLLFVGDCRETFIFSGGQVSGNGGPGAGVGGINYIAGCTGEQGRISGTSIVNNTGNYTPSSNLEGGAGGINATGGGLTISNVTISGNTATGSNTAGGVSLIGPGNVVDQATIRGNTGAGLLAASDTVVANVTISGNTGAGLLPAGGVSAENVTISGNGGDGVAFGGGAMPALTNVTIASNGGAGVRFTGGPPIPLRLQSTLLASNTAGNCVAGPSGPLQSLGSNLSSDTTCAMAFNQAGDQNNVNPLLGPLQNNGGTTETRALQPGSPAIDGVVSGCPPPTIDERGVTRPQGPRCDIGAYEAPPAPTLTFTPTVTPTLTPSPTLTLTPTPTRTPTPTPTLTLTATPFPRPNVGVGATPVPSTHTLQVPISARDAGCSPNNQLQALRFTRLANATVDVPGVGTISAPSTAPVPLPGYPATLTLTIRRVTEGQPTTVELVVTDGCGDWPTFVGGGPAAF